MASLSCSPTKVSISRPSAGWRITQSAYGAKQPLRRQPTLISDLSLTKIFLLVNLNHFRLLRVVGKGAFGKVRIVERKDTGLTFALKYIRKDEGWTQEEKQLDTYGRLIQCAVVRSESVRNIIRERRMLEHLNHPFLCNLRYSFQDIEYLSASTSPQF